MALGVEGVLCVEGVLGVELDGLVLEGVEVEGTVPEEDFEELLAEVFCVVVLELLLLEEPLLSSWLLDGGVLVLLFSEVTCLSSELNICEVLVDEVCEFWEVLSAIVSDEIDKSVSPTPFEESPLFLLLRAKVMLMIRMSNDNAITIYNHHF